MRSAKMFIAVAAAAVALAGCNKQSRQQAEDRVQQARKELEARGLVA